MKALQAENVDCHTWIRQPLHMFRSLIDRITYGESHYPFDSRPDVEYGEGLCPNAEALCSERVVVGPHEGWSEDDVRDVATAIRKVAVGLAGIRRGG